MYKLAIIKLASAGSEPINQKGICRIFQRLRLFAGLEAEIELKEYTSPKFLIAYCIPFTQHIQIEEELQRQVASGDLQPVDQSKYTTFIVAVTRKDEKLQICADTIIPYLKTLTYLLLCNPG